MASPKIFDLTTAKLYQLYLNKVLLKDYTEEELDQILVWLWDDNIDMSDFKQSNMTLRELIGSTPINSNASLIKGVVCGVRIEDIEDHDMQVLRYMDKLVDELAKGKKMARIIRT
ncbi:DUF2200 family protein [Paucilactobacillus nenjiangensis]|uniref:DUF2200 family protein n=1 Tax=Paucilactobacillus nenjiangensis TaxID=1296540 RepID=UPI003FA3005B